MSLATYEDTRPWAKAIKDEVLEKRMPPWHAAEGFGDFENDRSLTPIEIDLIVAWADGGAPKGEESDVPPPEKEEPGPALGGRPDLVVQDSGPTGLKQDRWIRAWEFRPADRSAWPEPALCAGRCPASASALVWPVEQATVWIVSGKGVRTYLGHWVPPEGPTVFPEGVGQLLPAGSRIALEVRSKVQSPRSKVGGSVAFSFSKEPPERRMHHRLLSCGKTLLAESMELLAARPVLPDSGKSLEFTARRPDDSVESLLWIHNYQRDYQVAYRYREPVALPKGTQLELWTSGRVCSAHLDYMVH